MNDKSHCITKVGSASTLEGRSFFSNFHLGFVNDYQSGYNTKVLCSVYYIINMHQFLGKYAPIYYELFS